MTALTPGRRANSDRVVETLHRRYLVGLRRAHLRATVAGDTERADALADAIRAQEELLTASPPIPAQRVPAHPGDDLDTRVDEWRHTLDMDGAS